MLELWVIGTSLVQAIQKPKEDKRSQPSTPITSKNEDKENRAPQNFIENEMTVDEVILFLKSKSHLELLDPFVEKFIVDQEVNGLTYNSTLLNECSLEKHLKKKIRVSCICIAIPKKECIDYMWKII